MQATLAPEAPVPSGLVSGATIGSTSEAAKHRNVTLDGLRGVASLLVAFYHLYGNLKAEFAGWLNPMLQWVFEHGFLGVQMFFVLSGYAIASAVGERSVTARFIGRFALRRSIRLDPPYWVSMALDAAVVVATASIVAGKSGELPSPEVYLAHVFYLQDLLRLTPISDVYWTLAIEVQFYLFFVCMLALVQRVFRAPSVSDLLNRRLLPLAMLMLAVISVASSARILPSPHGTFVPHWFLFALGALCFWFVNGRISRWWVIGTMLGILVIGISTKPLVVAVGLGTALLLLTAPKLRLTKPLLSSAPFQFLGRISYSLYLLHALLGWSAASFMRLLLDLRPGQPAATWLAFTVACAVSVASAWICYRLVEAPSQRLSRKVTMR